MKKPIYILFITIFSIVFIISGYFLINILLEYKKGTDTYSEIIEVAAPLDNLLTDEDINNRNIDFETLTSINKDIVGWIYVPDTDIDYPVVQGDDNEKYLNTLFNGKTNKAGSIFMDYRNKLNFTDHNTLIYGHHMKNGSMFKKTTNYAKQDFYDSHKNIYFYTKDSVYKLEVFSAYTIPAEDIYIQTYFKNKTETYQNFISRSKIKTDVSLTENDTIVTLSTCTYDYDDARFVTHCKVVKVK